MNVIEEVLRMRHGCGRSQREIGSACGLLVGAVNGLLQRVELAGLGWPLPAGLDADGLHERLYGKAAGRALGGAGLRGDAQGAEPAQEPDLAAAVAGVPRGAPGRVRVQPVLRAVPGVEGAAFADDAARAQGGGEAVRGLRRADGAGAGRGPGRGARGASVRGGAGGEFVLLRGSELGQDERNWLASHVRALEFFGGCAEILVPDYVPGNIIGPRGLREFTDRLNQRDLDTCEPMQVTVGWIRALTRRRNRSLRRSTQESKASGQSEPSQTQPVQSASEAPPQRRSNLSVAKCEWECEHALFVTCIGRWVGRGLEPLLRLGSTPFWKWCLGTGLNAEEPCPRSMFGTPERSDPVSCAKIVVVGWQPWRDSFPALIHAA